MISISIANVAEHLRQAISDHPMIGRNCICYDSGSFCWHPAAARFRCKDDRSMEWEQCRCASPTNGDRRHEIYLTRAEHSAAERKNVRVKWIELMEYWRRSHWQKRWLRRQ
jgi:hypothetical protein